MPSFESGGVDWWNVWGNISSSLSRKIWVSLNTVNMAWWLGWTGRHQRIENLNWVRMGRTKTHLMGGSIPSIEDIEKWSKEDSAKITDWIQILLASRKEILKTQSQCST